MLYSVLIQKSIRRMMAYRAATLAGLVTNLFFGLLRAYVFIALYEGLGGGSSRVAGYSLAEAITFTALAQALIGPLRMWGSYEIMERIREGDIASDLCKPIDIQAFWWARDMGQALFEFVARGIPLFIAYGLVFDLVWPTDPIRILSFAFAALMAVSISFHWRFIVNMAAFWTMDASGVGRLAFLGILLFTGLLMPLSFFPDGLETFARWLPFGAYINTPVEVYLGHVTGASLLRALAHQLIWLAILAFSGRWILGRGLRRLVIQGG